MERKSYATDSSKSVLSCINLAKSFRDKTILKNISLEIYADSVNSIIGQNGAGKTTLLRTILGLYFVTSGSIVKCVDDSDISMLLENDYLCEKKTGFQNIEHFCGYFNIQIDSVRCKIDRYSKILKLDNSLGFKVNTYSKGMKRKLSLLLILLRDTKMIILDEPTSGMDPISRVEIRKLLVELKHENKTIIITSHDLVEIQKLSDYITLINNGEVIHFFKGNIPHNDLERTYFEALSKEEYYETNIQD